MTKNRNLNPIQYLFLVIGFLNQLKVFNLMTNFFIELLKLSVVLVNFGAILTAKIYSQSLKEI